MKAEDHIQVPYDEITISANKEFHCDESEANLLDEREDAPELLLKHSRANFRGNGKGLEIYLNVESGPIPISHYAIKSSNDVPKRDPMKWDFITKDDEGRETILHSE